MKIAIIILVVAALAAIWLVTRSQGQTSSENKTDATRNEVSAPKDVYLGLRNTMLQGSRSKFSLAATAKPIEPWGVLMDWGVTNGTATVVAMSDGSASVYFSSGGGYIGGIGQEPIRRAAQKALDVARAVQLPSQPTTAYPLPEQHGVFFYFLTDAGVFMLRTSEQELNSSGHPLRKVGDAMQDVITQYRLWDASGRKVVK
ncbi:MAG TPA: hypothetical protein VKQ11_11185 [Candidatus Sulfotelmatobacter sp.]|nr:hypothetical protein [Candidatus Sulfotelmatobacter sp.]